MRLLTRIVAMALLCALALVAAMGLVAPWSPSGWFALGTAVVAALALAIKDQRPRRGLAAAAGVLLAILLAVRMLGAADGMIRMITLPQGNPSRWLGGLVDEQDVALAGARVLATKWRLPHDEQKRLLPAMREAYVEMRRDDAFTPSPVFDTILGRQTSGAFDTLVIEPRAESRAAVPIKWGVIFLHGYAGSHTLECWLVASAARTIGALTVCPATDFAGHWRGETGERIVRTSLDYLHARGIKRVYLAGLSNGAMGASALAPRLAASLVGLILISGAPANGETGGLPTLVVHGLQDTMTPAGAAREFAARTHATFAGFDGGHFVLLVRRPEAREAIANWLLVQSGYRTSVQKQR
jgi:pimeloyl-ACP methyl ester carboxylesterase